MQQPSDPVAPSRARRARASAGALLGWLACTPFGLPAFAASVVQQEFHAAADRVPDVVRGRELFETCAACHSSDGSGIDDGSVPAIAGQYFRVVVKELTDFRNDRRWDIRMEHFVDRHHLQGAAQIADVAGYIAALPPRPTPTHGDGSALAAGTSLYFRACEGCHGALGAGNGATLVPRLAGQHFDYLIREIHDTGDGRRPNMAQDHVRVVPGLTLLEITGIADYLSRLQPAAAGASGPTP